MLKPSLVGLRAQLFYNQSPRPTQPSCRDVLTQNSQSCPWPRGAARLCCTLAPRRRWPCLFDFVNCRSCRALEADHLFCAFSNNFFAMGTRTSEVKTRFWPRTPHAANLWSCKRRHVFPTEKCSQCHTFAASPEDGRFWALGFWKALYGCARQGRYY